MKHFVAYLVLALFVLFLWAGYYGSTGELARAREENGRLVERMKESPVAELAACRAEVVWHEERAEQIVSVAQAALNPKPKGD